MFVPLQIQSSKAQSTRLGMNSPYDSEIGERLVQISRLLDELKVALGLLLSRLAELEDQAPPPSAPLTDMVALQAEWTLWTTMDELETPAQALVKLTPGELQFLKQLFSAPDLFLAYDYNFVNVAERIPQTFAHRISSNNVLISRLKKKCLAHGVDLPVRSVRKCGYSFIGTARVKDWSR